MVHGKAEGIGELWFRRDDGFIHYTGEIAESEIHGVGIARLPNGTLVQGEFAHDALNGRVKITREDGSNYTGFVVDNEPHGRGIQITADQVGAFALPDGSADAAFLARVPPGSYTVVVRGALESQTGNALVEIYQVNPPQN